MLHPRSAEPRGVPELGGEPPALAHAVLAERLVGAEGGAARPVADGIGAVALDQLQGYHGGVPLRLAQLAARWVEGVAGEHHRLPGELAEVEVGLDDGVEGPGANNVVGLGPQLHWEEPLVER